MSPLKNENGMALISTLMLLVLGFAAVATLLRMVTAETKLSNLEQRYSTALDTGKAGADMFMFLVQNSLTAPPNPGIGTGTSPQAACFGVKLANATSSWTGAATWGAGGCPTYANATNSDPTINPDVTMNLSCQNPANVNTCYRVSLKLIDTVDAPAAVPPASPCTSGCYYYTVNIRSIAPTNEQANITFVYRVPH